MKEKIEKILLTAERANDPWFKNYWSYLAGYLMGKYEAEQEKLITKH
jgi:hypothetical protein